VSPWLIVSAGWPAAASGAAGLLSAAATHPGTDAIVAAAAALALGTGVLVGLRARERPRRRSTS
jgi:hypothetical protein